MSSRERDGYPTIGVLAGWQYYWTATSLSYLDPIYRGIRMAAREMGCHLLLGCGVGPSAASDDPLRPVWPVVAEDSDFAPIGPWNTDGLIVLNPLQSQARSRYLQEVLAAGHPLVFVGSGESGPTVVADNAGGIDQALRHLVDHGHHSIAFIAGSPEDIEGDSGDRLRAYQAGVQRYGLTAAERLIVFGRHVPEGGHAAIQQILSSRVPFTAVLASNDESAFGAIQALQEAGRSVPGDVAVIGFDNRLESAVLDPPLTSVHVPLFNMGYQAVARLRQQITAPDHPPERFHVPTRLVIRESCGCSHHPGLTRALEITLPVREGGGKPSSRARLARTMAAAVLAETQGLGGDEVETLCLRLLESLIVSLQEDEPNSFRYSLEAILKRAAAVRDDTHGWQAAVTIAQAGLPELTSHLSPAPAPDRATGVLTAALLDEARVIISAAMRRQHRQTMVDQRRMGDRIGLLTAQLLAALDEAQIYEILARHLPEIGIHTTWVGLFEAEGDDPVAWTQLRAVTTSRPQTRRIRSRAFPPPDWIAAEQPFSLALLPLADQRGGAGFVAFAAVKLDALGAIAQQMGTALNAAHLYRAATEGRRLAEEATRLKSRFLSTVSHELRTPLNLIVGTSGLLLRDSAEADAPLPKQVQRDVERIYSHARHLGRLIDDVLDLASSDAGQLRLTYDFVDLGQVMRLAAETGRHLALEKGLTWQQSLPGSGPDAGPDAEAGSGPFVWGDRTRLQQVTLNLISNAVKFTARGGVRLQVEQGADTVTVSVFDTGIGLPPAEQAAVFDEFRRSERSIHQGYGGIGLGLAICKRLVDLHQGWIGVESSGEEGAGSRFYFTLPTVAAPALSGDGYIAVEGTGPLPPQPRLGGGVILVLSTEQDGGRLRAELVRRGLQAQVCLMSDSAGWLAHLLSGKYDAVVLDISQGGEHAWEALKVLKHNPATQHIPALFYAASAAGGAVLELDYLTKPIEVASLTRALDQQWLASGGARHTGGVSREAVGAHARTFLVVDDDADTLDLHRRIIQSQARGGDMRNRVLTAGNGRAALEILKHTAVDVVLLDLVMPGLDGFGVLEAMQADKRTRDIPVIVITGQVLTEAEMARLNHGVATVMSKGVFGLEETLAQLQAALERRHKLSDEAQRAVRKAMAFIHEHYAEPIARHDLARYVGMSDDYLTHCFRQELGMTPIAYLNRFRVTQAKRLLTETDRSITTIALDVGFSTSGYFSRVFHREAGASPEAFRRRG